MASWHAMRPAGGYDPQAKWLLVPHQGENQILLENGGNCTVLSSNPAIASVQEGFAIRQGHRPGARMFLIGGGLPGAAQVNALGPDGSLCARLDVTCKRRRPIKVKFHFVSDSVGHRTHRTDAHLGGWLEEMNRILTPQTNVEVVSLGSRPARYPTDLGRMVLTRNPGATAAIPPAWEEMRYIQSQNDPAADLNFYFVWRTEIADATTPTPRQLFRADTADAWTQQSTKICVFEDGMQDDCVVESLCHELGHELGCADFYTHASRHWVMHGYTSPGRRVVPKAHALQMNP